MLGSLKLLATRPYERTELPTQAFALVPVVYHPIMCILALGRLNALQCRED